MSGQESWKLNYLKGSSWKYVENPYDLDKTPFKSACVENRSELLSREILNIFEWYNLRPKENHVSVCMFIQKTTVNCPLKNC